MIKQLRKYFLRSFNAVDKDEYERLEVDYDSLLESNRKMYNAMNNNQQCFFELTRYGFTTIGGRTYSKDLLRCPVTGRFIKDDTQ